MKSKKEKKIEKLTEVKGQKLVFNNGESIWGFPDKIEFRLVLEKINEIVDYLNKTAK